MHRLTFSSACRAFTLLEMAATLLIIGLMAALLLRTEAVVAPSNCIPQTQEKLAHISASIDSYVRSQNRYPVPASRTLGVSDPSFGHEASLGDIDSIANAGHAVLAGALPFHALGLGDDYAADCWGNKFSYFVTEDLTVTGGGSGTAQGVIELRSAPSAVITSNAAYAVISHGETAEGAAPKNYSGADRRWCDVGLARDSENCDGKAAGGNAVLYAAPMSVAAGADFFDDLIAFAAKSSSNCNDSYAVDWTVGLDTCSGTVGALANGATLDVTSVAPAGSARFKCANGTVVIDTSVSYSCGGTCPIGGGGMCGAPCPTQILSWGSGCSASFDGISSGTTSPLTTNTTIGHTGAAQASCIAGAWAVPTGSCAP